MRSILNKFVLVPAVMTAAVLVSNTAMAETRVNVPFNFTVAGKTCPAGSYMVERNALGVLVTLKATDAQRTFTWMVGPGEPNPADTRVVLKFDEIGQDHTLRSIQYGSKVTSRLNKHSMPERGTTRTVEGQ